MSKPIKKIIIKDEKSKKTKQWICQNRCNTFILDWKKKKYRQTVGNYDVITRNYQIVANEFGKTTGTEMTIKHLRCQVFIGKMSGFTTWDVVNSVDNAYSPFNAGEEYTVQTSISEKMIQAKAYLFYTPETITDFTKRNIFYKESSNDIINESEQNIFLQHPEWILDCKVFNWSLFDSMTFELNSHTARNLKPFGKIYIVLVFQLKTMSWKVWFPQNVITVQASYTVGV